MTISSLTAGSFLNLTATNLTSNSVQYSLTERNKNGLGGAVYLQNSGFLLNRLNIGNNSAYLGAGVFVHANLSAGGLLQNLAFGLNTGLLGIQ